MPLRLRCMTSLYLTDEAGILCLYRIGSRVADRMYIGSAGGHFEPGELNDPMACVLREMGEELGLNPEDVEGLTLRYVTCRLKNGEIRQNYYYFARLKERKELSSTEGTLRWVPYAEVPSLEMPASAKDMILHYLAVGRFDRRLYCGVTERSGTAFVPMEEFGDRDRGEKG